MDDLHGMLRRFRERLRRNAVLDTAWRGTVFLIGVVILAAGLVMMVTPGPGIAGIVVGLAILATEFVWARRALHRARHAARRAKEKALDPRRRRRNQVLAGALAAVVAASATAYLWAFGLAIPWAD